MTYAAATASRSARTPDRDRHAWLLPVTQKIGGDVTAEEANGMHGKKGGKGIHYLNGYVNK